MDHNRFFVWVVVEHDNLEQASGPIGTDDEVSTRARDDAERLANDVVDVFIEDAVLSRTARDLHFDKVALSGARVKCAAGRLDRLTSPDDARPCHRLSRPLSQSTVVLHDLLIDASVSRVLRVSCPPGLAGFVSGGVDAERGGAGERVGHEPALAVKGIGNPVCVVFSFGGTCGDANELPAHGIVMSMGLGVLGVAPDGVAHVAFSFAGGKTATAHVHDNVFSIANAATTTDTPISDLNVLNARLTRCRTTDSEQRNCAAISS